MTDAKKPKSQKLGSNATKFSRRGFLKASAVASIAMPYIIPEGVLAQGGRPGANDRISIGNIGIGGRGTDLLNAANGSRDTQVVALCDVDANHLADAAKKVKGNPFTSKDYRDILERNDVDAVMIGAPDHWHGLMTVNACQAGKDVYSEKPTCRTIHEGQQMIKASQRYGRVVQIGAQGRSHPFGRATAEFIRNGQLGRVNQVEVWHAVNYTGGTLQQKTPPPELDWDLWLGPAAWRPYNPDIVHFNFRWVMDLGGGFIRDRGNHILSIVSWCMNADNIGPVSVEATGQRTFGIPWDVPTTMDVKWEFKNPDWTLTWSQPGARYKFPGSADIDWGAKFYGDRDNLIFLGGDSGQDVEMKVKQYQTPADGIHVYRSTDHFQNWVDCIRSRQKPVMNVEIGHRVVSLAIIANISYILGRKLQWDATKQEFIGDAEANRWLNPPYRGSWRI
ncbi:MAG: Gfo/Idh/MocA family oxidoreductase [Abitibacteriaceae bacterium]|nr:Gfo/Idh/MocA family oxidoreductase [Abditibacteriaceae bacterium]